MDQLFAFLKSIIEGNRKELYKILLQQCEGHFPEEDEDDDDFLIIIVDEDDDNDELTDLNVIEDLFYDLSEE